VTAPLIRLRKFQFLAGAPK